MTTAAAPPGVTVVGAGIVGICCAFHLQRDGHRVTVVDPDPPGSNCSYGNAGLIVPHACVPLSVHGTLSQVPRWLLDPLGPLAVRAGHLPRALPWLLRFVRSGRPARVAHQARALRALNADAMAEYRPLVKAAGAERLLNPSGWLAPLESATGHASLRLEAELRRANGVVVEEIDGAELRQLEPALTPIYERALLVAEGGHVSDPGGLVAALAEAFVRAGGEILTRRVTGLALEPTGPRRIETDAGPLPVDRLVVAAGAWSHRLTSMLGDPVPLEAERGYHLMVREPGVALRRPVQFLERMFVATPMDAGLRLAGTAEFAGLDAPPNPARADALARHAARALRGFRAGDATRWMGRRPSTPDSLPVISPARRFAEVFYAFGHGHLGLTGGAATGRHVADLVAGRRPSIDLSPFRVDRF